MLTMSLCHRPEYAWEYNGKQNEPGRSCNKETNKCKHFLFEPET